jgi:hypothetical protein
LIRMYALVAIVFSSSKWVFLTSYSLPSRGWCHGEP